MSLADMIRGLDTTGFDGSIIPKAVEVALAILVIGEGAESELVSISQRANVDFATILMANLRECGAAAHMDGMPRKGNRFHELSRYVLEERQNADSQRIPFRQFCIILAVVCTLARDEYDRGVSDEAAMIRRDGDNGQELHFLDRGVSEEKACILKESDLGKVQLFLDECADLIPV